MKTFYVIRSGWNSANQSSVGSCRAPQSDFDSRYYRLVKIVDADSEESALKQCSEVTVYNGQSLLAVSNPRSLKGLTAAIRDFNSPSFAW